MDPVLQTLAANDTRYLRELAELVAIPSIGTDPARASGPTTSSPKCAGISKRAARRV